jgi:hypothetical protein
LSEISRRGLLGAGLSGALLAVAASDRSAQAADGSGYVPIDTLVVNVMDHGARGDGVTDDTAAIQATINGSAPGSTIFFPGGRTYLISSPIRLLGDRAYLGGGWHLSNAAAIIKQKSGANMVAAGASAVTGLFVDNGWYVNNPYSSNPILVENLAFDGNRANNPSSTACGIVLYGYWSCVRRCRFFNVPVDGIHLTDTAQNDSTRSGTNSENRFLDNKIAHVGRHGIYSRNMINTSNQDGYCEDNLIDRTGGDGIRFDRISGWYLRRNHLYDIAKNGIFGTNAFATVLEDNEIEDFGNANAGGTWYWGIYITQLDNRGTTVRGNFVGCREPAGTANFQYISVTASTAQKDAHAIVTNNLVKGNGGAKGTGLVLQNQSGAVLTVVAEGNRISNVRTEAYIQPGVVVTSRSYGAFTVDGPLNARGHITSANNPSVALAAGSQATSVVATAGRVTPNDTAGAITINTVSAPVAGPLATVTFGSAFASPPASVRIQAESPPAAACQAYVDSITARSFVIRAAVAPAGGTPLLFSYQVVG